ncbi:MAG TPA: cytochrome C biogenesis protein [Myxococcales bacterium]|nr:cytochrome C biogenesis protein [Myxococcales bacterium]
MRKAKLLSGALLAALLVALVPEVAGPGPTADFTIGSRLEGGALAIPLLLIFLGGLLTALTPCVYPLIPITVSVFGARQASSRSRAIGLTSVYVLGIAVMFTSLGILAALTGRAFGSVLGNPWVVVGLAALFTLFAASMFGAFDFQLPSSLQTKLGGMGKAGFAGAFGMGLVAGVVAAPCTGPVLSGVLLHVATTQNVPLGAALLFAYALGLGVPFFLIGAFSLSLPKSGGWMEGVKSVFGIALLALAILYLRDAFPAVRDALSLEALSFGALLAAALVFLGVLAGAVHRSFHSWPAEGALKAVGVLLAVAGIALRPHAPLAEPPPAPQIEWLTSEAQAIERARAEGKPVVIDFYADWCAACKELAKITFVDRGFVAEAQRFVLVKIDGTDETEEIEQLYEKYGVRGLPTVLFLDSSGKVRPELTVTGFLPAGKFTELMRQLE